MTASTDPRETVVELQGVTICYGRHTAAEDVSFAVPSGSVYALLGRNGSGKTSLVRCLLGQYRASSGTVRLLGRDIWKHRVSVMARIGVVPERAEIPLTMTAKQVERFCSDLYPSWDQDCFGERLRRFGVPEEKLVGSLSKGQQRQLALALALATSPELVVLDDPTLGLDVVARRDLFEELIGELAERRVSVLLTTHDLAGLEGIADRIGILSRGRLLVDEPLESLKQRHRRLRTSIPASTMANTLLEPLAPITIRIDGNQVEAVIGACDQTLLSNLAETGQLSEVQLESLSLEEIFIALCGESEECAP